MPRLPSVSSRMDSKIPSSPSFKRRQSPSTAISSPSATTRCCCSTVTATVWRPSSVRAMCTALRTGRNCSCPRSPVSKPWQRGCLPGGCRFAKPEIYEASEERAVKYAIRLPANENLRREVAELLVRPVGRPTRKPLVRYRSFLYRAASWSKARRVVAKVEHHAGELFPRDNFIVTNLTLPSRSRGALLATSAGRPSSGLKLGKQATHCAATRLSCHSLPGERSVRLRVECELDLHRPCGNLWPAFAGTATQGSRAGPSLTKLTAPAVLRVVGNDGRVD